MNGSRLIAGALLASSSLAAGQSLPDPRIAGAVLLLTEEPPAKVAADPPLAGPLSRGEAVIPYRTQNIRLLPQFGAAAATASPRIGHLHLSLDDAPWVWVNASSTPVVLNGLRPGPHKLRLQLETANHQQLDQDSVSFTIPPRSAAAQSLQVAPMARRIAAKLVIDPPVAEPLARGVLFVEPHATGLRILPQLGPTARGASPPIGHLHLSLDGASWYWEDASGGPIIINGLAAGRHALAITLVNADHRQIDRGVVSFVIPAPAPHQ
jgi:hypothetical protein